VLFALLRVYSTTKLKEKITMKKLTLSLWLALAAAGIIAIQAMPFHTSAVPFPTCPPSCPSGSPNPNLK
jgi:hypothetical protein